MQIAARGPWTVYSDPRVPISISWPDWGTAVQLPLLQGERSWQIDDTWTDAAKGTRDCILKFLAERSIAITIDHGVATIADPRFSPIDEATRRTCEECKLVTPDDIESGLFQLWRPSANFDLFVRSAVTLSSSEWSRGVPLAEVEFHSGYRTGRYAVVGRLDVRRVDKPWGPYVKAHLLRLHDMARPRWRTSAKATSRHVAEWLPAWDAYLERERERAAAEEAAASELTDEEAAEIASAFD